MKPSRVVEEIGTKKQIRSVDDISGNILCEIAQRLSIPLLIMLNLPLIRSIVPGEWKEANSIEILLKNAYGKFLRKTLLNKQLRIWIA